MPPSLPAHPRAMVSIPDSPLFCQPLFCFFQKIFASPIRSHIYLLFPPRLQEKTALSFVRIAAKTPGHSQLNLDKPPECAGESNFMLRFCPAVCIIKHNLVRLSSRRFGLDGQRRFLCSCHLRSTAFWLWTLFWFWYELFSPGKRIMCLVMHKLTASAGFRQNWDGRWRS